MYDSKGFKKLFGVSNDLQHQNAKLFPNLLRLSIGSLGLSDVSLPCLVPFVHNHCPKLLSVDFSSYKSTNFFGSFHNKFTNTAFESLISLAKELKSNAIIANSPDWAFIGFEHCFNLKQVNNDDMMAFSNFMKILNQEPLQLSVNGIQHKTHEVSLPILEISTPNGGILRNPRISATEMKSIINPMHAVDLIDSIYRNTMK